MLRILRDAANDVMIECRRCCSENKTKEEVTWSWVSFFSLVASGRPLNFTGFSNIKISNTNQTNAPAMLDHVGRLLLLQPFLWGTKQVLVGTEKLLKKYADLAMRKNFSPEITKGNLGLFPGVIPNFCKLVHLPGK